MMDVLGSPWTPLVILITFVGSLFACRGWTDRIWFMLVMPVVYGFMWFIAVLGLSGILGHLLPVKAEVVYCAILVISTVVCLGVFVVMVCSMSKDTPGGPAGYSTGKPTARSPLHRETTRLSRIPTRRRWSG